MSEMKIKEEEHKIEIKKLYQDMQEKSKFFISNLLNSETS